MPPFENPWISPRLDSLFPELGLFFSRKSHTRWGVRCAEWRRHFEIYQRIKGTEARGATIDFLFQHLGVVDQKLGMLLTFNSLLAAGPVVFVTNIDKLTNLISAVHKQLFQWFSVGIIAAFSGSWLFVLFLCLVSVRRLVWGDLGHHLAKIRLEDLRDPPPITDDDVKTAEKTYVRDLIFAVVNRTNKFRVAILFTNLAVVSLSILLFLVMYIWIAHLKNWPL
jgi:hypothetical protein